MSREIRGLISGLEQERQDIQDFYEEVQRQVAAREITQELAEELLRREFNNIPYQELIREKNRLLTEANSILREERRELTIKATPVVILILLAVGVAWNFTAITGFFTLGANENFYRLDIAEQYATNVTVPLAITANISSLRIDGNISGIGNAKLWLEANGTRFLVTSFDSSESTGLTGFATSGDVSNATENVTNDTPSENASNGTLENISTSANTTENAPNETLTAENLSNETNATPENSTNVTNATPPTENIPQVNATENVTMNETNVTLPANETQVVVLPSQPEQPAATGKTVTLSKTCAETCNLPAVSPEYALVVEISGNITVTVADIIYGVPIANVNENINASENITPANATGNATNETAQPGVTCAADSDCAGGACIQSTYQGERTAEICAPNKTFCVENATAYPSGSAIDDSTCYAGAEGAWITSPGSGRFDIKDNSNNTVAVIDKYGNMAILGNATFDTQPGDSGWVLRNANQTVQLSIDTSGNLLAAGNLSTHAVPQPTAGGDLIIQNRQNATVAVLTETGDVELAGDFSQGVKLS